MPVITPLTVLFASNSKIIISSALLFFSPDRAHSCLQKHSLLPPRCCPGFPELYFWLDSSTRFLEARTNPEHPLDRARLAFSWDTDEKHQLLRKLGWNAVLAQVDKEGRPWGNVGSSHNRCRRWQNSRQEWHDFSHSRDALRLKYFSVIMSVHWLAVISSFITEKC